MKNSNEFLDGSIRPPKGSNLYLVPGCPASVDSIRANYHLKRGMDNGEFNVFHPLAQYGSGLWLSSYAIFPSKKAIVDLNSGKEDSIEDCVSRYFTDYDLNEAIFCGDGMHLRFFSDAALPFKNLLDGIISKPCIDYTQLDLDTENELTQDVLQIVFETGKVYYDSEALKNFVVQLNVLNNHNWRKYPGTIAMLLKEITRSFGNSTSRTVIRHLSRYSKSINELYKTDCTFKSEEDIRMAQEFVDKLLNIGSTRFTDVASVIRKISEIGLSMNTFDQLYSNVVRLTPRTYVKTDA